MNPRVELTTRVTCSTVLSVKVYPKVELTTRMNTQCCVECEGEPQGGTHHAGEQHSSHNDYLPTGLFPKEGSKASSHCLECEGEEQTHHTCEQVVVFGVWVCRTNSASQSHHKAEGYSPHSKYSLPTVSPPSPSFLPKKGNRRIVTTVLYLLNVLRC